MNSTDLSSQEKQRKFHELQIPLLRDTSIEALLWICPLVALWVSNHVVKMQCVLNLAQNKQKVYPTLVSGLLRNFIVKGLVTSNVH